MKKIIKITLLILFVLITIFSIDMLARPMIKKELCSYANSKEDLLNCINIDRIHHDRDFNYNLLKKNSGFLKINSINDSDYLLYAFYLLTDDEEDIEFIFNEYSKCYLNTPSCFNQYVELLEKYPFLSKNQSYNIKVSYEKYLDKNGIFQNIKKCSPNNIYERYIQYIKENKYIDIFKSCNR